MDVKVFLCVLLSSSTVQLPAGPDGHCLGHFCIHYFFTIQKVLVADAHGHIQRLISVVKIATVIEECTTEEHRFCLPLFWTKGIHEKYMHGKMFPVCCGKCLSRKAVHKWVEKRGKLFADDERLVVTEVRKWLRQ
jgi:hypothetical protein